MKLNGLKVIADKGWKPDSTFVTQDGRSLAIPASHKFVCTDESGEIVNATIISPAPVVCKVGDTLKELTLAGACNKNAFGWQIKVHL